MRDRLLFIARRLREPSTAAGLAVLATLAGARLGAAELQAITEVVAAVAAAVAIFMPEAGRKLPQAADEQKAE